MVLSAFFVAFDIDCCSVELYTSAICCWLEACAEAFHQRFSTIFNRWIHHFSSAEDTRSSDKEIEEAMEKVNLSYLLPRYGACLRGLVFLVPTSSLGGL